MRTPQRRLLSFLLLISLAIGVSACPWWRHDGEGERHEGHEEHHDDHHDEHHDGDRR